VFDAVQDLLPSSEEIFSKVVATLAPVLVLIIGTSVLVGLVWYVYRVALNIFGATPPGEPGGAGGVAAYDDGDDDSVDVDVDGDPCDSIDLDTYAEDLEDSLKKGCGDEGTVSRLRRVYRKQGLGEDEIDEAIDYCIRAGRGELTDEDYGDSPESYEAYEEED